MIEFPESIKSKTTQQSPGPKKRAIEDVANKKFPMDLSPARYVVFDFYEPTFISGVTKALEIIVSTAATAVNKGISADDIKQKAKQIATIGGNMYNKLSNELNKRVSFDDGKFTGNVSTMEIEKNASEYEGSVYLPLTNSLSEEITHEYSSQRGGVSNLLDKIISGDGVAQTAINGLANFTGSRTILVNPDYVQTYKGAGMRGVQLEWILIPNNKEEAAIIFNIIRVFKEYSSPIPQTAKALLLAPAFVAVTFNNKVLDNSVRLDEMVIDSVGVNYSETGFMESFWDGTPKALKLSLGLKERRMKTRDDWSVEDTRKQRNELIQITKG